jgi:sulfur-oxidizing protein SoxX
MFSVKEHVESATVPLVPAKAGTQSVATRLLKMLLWIPACAGMSGGWIGAHADELRPYTIVGDAIPGSLTGARGDAARGRAIVVARQNTCLLCHSGPFPEEKFQGDLSPNLSGTGARWSEGELRLRLVDAAKLNAATIMPSYYRIDGLARVAAPWRGKPVLTAEQIEDVVAFLMTLREEAK